MSTPPLPPPTIHPLYLSRRNHTLGKLSSKPIARWMPCRCTTIFDSVAWHRTCGSLVNVRPAECGQRQYTNQQSLSRKRNGPKLTPSSCCAQNVVAVANELVVSPRRFHVGMWRAWNARGCSTLKRGNTGVPMTASSRPPVSIQNQKQVSNLDRKDN